jgi:NAD(P)-dependent dehydrogenase (short-subunit alcohol dehydrogenase family)
MLAIRGTNVICCARRLPELKELVESIERRGGSALAQQCDVSDEISIAKAFDAAQQRFGLIDSTIVNAGIAHAAPAIKITASTFDQVMAVNLRGAFFTAREAGARLIASGEPDPARPRRIIFIASTTGQKPERGAAAYGASKAAVIMLAKTLALEWARHQINVNAILPGFMRTEMVAEYLDSDAGLAQISKWPRKRVMPIEDLESSVLFLLSAQSRAVSGIDLVIDGTQML